jgi:hypothetical protein
LPNHYFAILAGNGENATFFPNVLKNVVTFTTNRRLRSPSPIDIGAEVARLFNMSRSGVSIAAVRGEKILRNNQSLRNGLDKGTT